MQETYRVDSDRGTRLAEFVRVATVADYEREFGSVVANDEDPLRIPEYYVVVRTLPTQYATGGTLRTVHVSARHT